MTGWADLINISSMNGIVAAGLITMCFGTFRLRGQLRMLSALPLQNLFYDLSLLLVYVVES